VLSERSASLQDADPRLGAALAAGGASALAHAPLLPVLRLEAGAWQPPSPVALGPQTARLVVLTGWLRRTGGEIFGPGDALEPWDEAGGGWHVCTGARLAVIGAAFAAGLEAARDVAGAGATPRARTLRLAQPCGEGGDERLLALLWSLAARWGRTARDGPALPPELDAVALAGILDVASDQTEATLAALVAHGALRLAADGGWQLCPPPRASGLRGRRDALRARMAVQLALSRAITEDAQALADEARAERSRAASRAARRRSA
jgi:hypothetical protein